LQKLDNYCYVKYIVEYKNKKYYIIKKKNYLLATISFLEDYSILFKLNFAKICLSQEIILKKIKI